MSNLGRVPPGPAGPYLNASSQLSAKTSPESPTQPLTLELLWGGLLESKVTASSGLSLALLLCDEQ